MEAIANSKTQADLATVSSAQFKTAAVLWFQYGYLVAVRECGNEKALISQ